MVDLFDPLAADRGGRGTEGRIEEYPLGTVAATGAQLGARTDLAAVATGAAAGITATLAAAAGARTYLAGFDVDGLGATAGSVIVVTVTGLLGGTRSYELTIPAGAGVALANPLRVQLPTPIPASADNTAIVVNVPSFGAGNTSELVDVHGYQLTTSGSVPTAGGVQAIGYGADLHGWVIAESTGAAPARCRIHDGRDATGPVMAPVSVAAGGTSPVWFGDTGMAAEIGLYLEVVSGSVEATLYIKAPGTRRRP